MGFVSRNILVEEREPLTPVALVVVDVHEIPAPILRLAILAPICSRENRRRGKIGRCLWHAAFRLGALDALQRLRGIETSLRLFVRRSVPIRQSETVDWGLCLSGGELRNGRGRELLGWEGS